MVGLAPTLGAGFTAIVPKLTAGNANVVKGMIGPRVMAVVETLTLRRKLPAVPGFPDHHTHTSLFVVSASMIGPSTHPPGKGLGEQRRPPPDVLSLITILLGKVLPPSNDT